MRRTRTTFAAAAALALLPACGSRETSEPATPAATPAAEAPAANAAIPDDATRIGDPITVTGVPVKLAEVRADPASYYEKTLLVEATAAAVCQARGCWMTLTDGVGEPIWVRWSTGCGGDYAFPKDAAGRRVIVQGSFYPKEISAEDAAHLAEESGTLKADDIAGETFEINATACAVLPADPAAPPAG